MKQQFRIGTPIKYGNLTGKIVGFYPLLNHERNIFEAEVDNNGKPGCLLFDKEGYVRPFSQSTPNAVKVQILESEQT